ncbi:MAG: sulfatase-like hydrolase/transferase, partial [Solirubrobacterales bacterium]
MTMSLSRATSASLTLIACLAATAIAVAPAQARQAGKGKQPNIVVIMTDDQNLDDLDKMPNTQKLLVKQGTNFKNAVTSFPLCCPGRATFITGQYAHNNGVVGNFYPYGWYGMPNRENILPAWLQRSGYRTGMVGKWLNGYGAKNLKGEKPKGFDVWRGLLDLSAYDYYNFVMSIDGKKEKIWGDKTFARKLVQFGQIQTIPREEPVIR